jgi:Tfp pilus assembly protein PilF
MIICRNCGASIARTDQTCSYCGSPNPSYEPITADLDARLDGAMGALQAGNYASAVKLYRTIIADNPEIFMAYFYLGYCLNQLGQHGEGIDAMKQALKLRPGNASLHYNVGVMEQSRHRNDEARTYLQRALELADTDPNLEDRDDFRARVRQALAKRG